MVIRKKKLQWSKQVSNATSKALKDLNAIKLIKVNDSKHFNSLDQQIRYHKNMLPIFIRKIVFITCFFYTI